jgi:hypothetical protein
MSVRRIEIDLELHRLIEGARRSFEESECEILKRELSGSVEPDADPPERAAPSTVESAIPIGSRTTGQWSVDAHGGRFLARNLREAYLTAIAKVSEKRPDVLDQLADEGDGRRRIVARRPADLYPRSPHLAERHRNNWHQLGEWYVDLNLSREQASKRIRRACALAGLRYGKDLTIYDALRAL